LSRHGTHETEKNMKAFIRSSVLFAAMFLALCTVAIPSAQAQVSPNLKVGDRVAMPAGFQDKWMDAVIVEVDPSKPYPYRVHPLGYLDTMNQSFSAPMLKAPGTIQTMPIGGIGNDPWLLKVQGRKAFQPTAIYAGAYECFTLSGGGTASLSSAMQLNFAILDGSRYRDVAGHVGTYSFNPNGLGIVFQGGTLNGMRATYAQPSNPPNRNTPPNITFAVSGDSCDAKL
jgi:hypothetical protein